MLYGMDDDDEDYNEEFSLATTQKLNIKKVILVVAIIICAIIVVYMSYRISYKLLNKNQSYAIDNQLENNENSEQITSQEKEVIAAKKIDNKKSKSKDSEKAYEGNHIQIPAHNIEKIKNKVIPQPNANAHQIIKDIYTSDEKQVYLTFDDGPSKNVTPQILDILKENNVQATFFLLGARIELYPDLVKREYEEGHYLANHGYSHKYSQIYQSKDTTFEEYAQCENAIKAALGNPNFNTYLFRFPGGSSGGHYEDVKSEARQMFKDYGVAFTNWNCLTGDAENKTTKEACIQEMIDTKADQNSIILLMHDANDKTQTVEALPEIIQYFKNEGYIFKNFYEVFK